MTNAASESSSSSGFRSPHRNRPFRRLSTHDGNAKRGLGELRSPGVSLILRPIRFPKGERFRQKTRYLTPSPMTLRLSGWGVGSVDTGPRAGIIDYDPGSDVELPPERFPLLPISDNLRFF